MLKSILGRFGLGKFPADVKASLANEGIEIMEEGIWGSATYKGYRAPGRWSAWRRKSFLGAIALTSRRIMAYIGAERHLHLPYDQPALHQVDFSLESPDCLRASYRAEHFHSDRSGQVELRFYTPQAAYILGGCRHHHCMANGFIILTHKSHRNLGFARLD